MPVHDTNREKAEQDEAADVTAQPPEAEQTTFTSDGDLPAVAKEGAAAEATASELAFDQPASADTSVLDQGLHEPEAYKAVCDQAGATSKWDEKYRNGHTSASQFTQPYDTRSPMEWHLKKGESASEAVKAFVKGPTIADYRAIAVACDLNELRDELGDIAFDRLFGSTNGGDDAAIPLTQRLTISSAMYTTPYVDQMKKIAQDSEVTAEADEPAPPPVVEQREEKPKAEAEAAQDPIVVAQEIGAEQQNREIL